MSGMFVVGSPDFILTTFRSSSMEATSRATPLRFISLFYFTVSFLLSYGCSVRQ